MEVTKFKNDHSVDKFVDLGFTPHPKFVSNLIDDTLAATSMLCMPIPALIAAILNGKVYKIVLKDMPIP